MTRKDLEQPEKVNMIKFKDPIGAVRYDRPRGLGELQSCVFGGLGSASRVRRWEVLGAPRWEGNFPTGWRPVKAFIPGGSAPDTGSRMGTGRQNPCPPPAGDCAGAEIKQLIQVGNHRNKW